MMHTAGKIGTDLYDLSALPAVHDDGLSHLVARSLEPDLLGAHTVSFRRLDLQFQVAIAAQRCAFAGVPS